MCRRGQEYDVARQEHALLRTELQSLERVFQEARNLYSQEVEELKRAQDLHTNDYSRQELRESQFTVNEFTAQIQELPPALPLVIFGLLAGTLARLLRSSWEPQLLPAGTRA